MTYFNKTIITNIIKNIIHPYRLVIGIACAVGMMYSNRSDFLLDGFVAIYSYSIYALFVIFGLFVADILSTLCGSEPERKNNIIITSISLMLSLVILFICIFFKILYISCLFGIIAVISLFLFIMSICDPNSIDIFSSTYGHYEIDD